MKISGIYKIVNKINKKYYVGSSNNIVGKRFHNHKNQLNSNKHINTHLQNAWNKYGEHNFDFIIVEKLKELDLLIVEQRYLDIAKLEKDKCYNISFVAGKIEMTDEIKRKISNSKKGITSGNKNPMFGKTHTEESINKIKLARSKQIFTEEQKNKSIQSRIKKETYKFQNIKTNEIFTGTQYEFRNYTKLNPYMLLKRIRKQYCGWIIV